MTSPNQLFSTIAVYTIFKVFNIAKRKVSSLSSANGFVAKVIMVSDSTTSLILKYKM